MKADVIIKGKAIFTTLKNEPEELIVVLKGSKITAIDDVDKMDKYWGRGTKVIDAGNRLVMPGFHDSHLHLFPGALFTAYSVSLTEATSLAEVQQLLKDFEKETKNDWIIGTGWDHTAWGQSEF